MDPKALSNLDPKLRETYERVMGTSSPSSSFAPSPTASSAPVAADGGSVVATATVSTTPEGPVAQASAAPLSAPVAPQPTSTWPPAAPAAPAAASPSPNPFAPSGQPLPSPSSVTASTKESSPMLRILYIVGAVIFFAVYTVFWIKVFKLPFLF